MFCSVMRTICVVVLFSFLLNFCAAHTEEDVRRGKEKWFKQPEDIADHGHDHGHHHHDHGHGHHHHHGHVHDHHHGHVHDHHHGHDHGHHHHDHGHHHHDHGHHHHGHDHGHHHHGHDHGHHHHGHAHTHDHAHKPAKKARTLTETIDMWWQALFATVLISAAPFVILYAVPLESDAEKYQPLLKVLLSFASGGLLGDAFLHLIPHAISPHSHGEDGEHHHHHHDEHDHSASTAVGMWVMAGVVAFLWIEKVVRLMQGGEGCHHHHAHQEEKEELKDEAEESTSEEKKSDDSGDSELRKRNVKSKDDGATEEKAEEEEKKEDKEEKAEVVEEEKPMKVSGYLNLAADFFHNFTDGLAIGASFLGGQKLGFITTLTILFHEVPHEIGDFAILVQSGCDKKKAMWLQLSTATGAMLGCVIGLLAENVGEATTSWILPFTAGGFIYIATVSVIPELLKETSDLKQTVKEISAMLMGIGMMVVIAMMEH